MTLSRGRYFDPAATRCVPTAALLLIERVLPANPPYPLEPFMLDIMMMVLLGSQERTEHEWRDLLSAEGFNLRRFISTGIPMHIVEAAPVG